MPLYIKEPDGTILNAADWREEHGFGDPMDGWVVAVDEFGTLTLMNDGGCAHPFPEGHTLYSAGGFDEPER